MFAHKITQCNNDIKVTVSSQRVIVYLYRTAKREKSAGVNVRLNYDVIGRLTGSVAIAVQ